MGNPFRENRVSKASLPKKEGSGRPSIHDPMLVRRYRTVIGFNQKELDLLYQAYLLIKLEYKRPQLTYSAFVREISLNFCRDYLKSKNKPSEVKQV